MPNFCLLNVTNLRVFACLSIAGLCSISFCQMDPQRDFVASGKSAFLMLPPEFVCGPKVQQMVWGNDGVHLAVLRRFEDITTGMIKDLIAQQPGVRAEPEQQLIVWSPTNRKTTTVLRLKPSQGEITEVSWIVGSSQMAVVGVFNPANPSGEVTVGVMVVSSAGSTIPVAQFSVSERYEVLPSPYKSQVALVRFPNSNLPKAGSSEAIKPSIVRTFGTNGILSPAFTMPEGSSLFWSSNGQLFALGFERDKSKPKKSVPVWYLANKASQKFERVATSPPDASPNEPTIKHELEIQNLNAKAAVKKIGVNAPIVVVQAETPEEDAPTVVTTDGGEGQISPTYNAISYIYQGSAMVRPMVKVPLEAYKQAKLAAIRMKLMNQAKQVALGLIMNMSDMDDNFVSNKGDWKTQLEPYMRDSSVFDGFNYTFGGGASGKINDPANTQLGYLEGTGGRAVAYADGHVKWIPNP